MITFFCLASLIKSSEISHISLKTPSDATNIKAKGAVSPVIIYFSEIALM